MPNFNILTFISSGRVAGTEDGRSQPNLPIQKVEGFKMDAIVNLVLATSVWAAVGHAGLPPAISQTETTPIRDPIAVNETCTKIKCQGDFPISPTRRYAEVKQDGHYREPHGIEERIFLAESKYQGVEVCPVWDLSGGIKKGTLRLVSCFPGGFNFQLQR